MVLIPVGHVLGFDEILLKMQMVKIRQHRNGLRVLKKKRKWT